MKYKIGDEVVSITGVKYKISDVHPDIDAYYVEGTGKNGGGVISERNLDHEKTAELNGLGELEK